MKLVRTVMQLTHLRCSGADDQWLQVLTCKDIIKLGSFVVASYLGLLIMFAVHGLLLGVAWSPLKYFRRYGQY